MLVVALLGRMVTTVVPVGIVNDLAFLLGLAGVVALMAGREALGRYGFALFFLVFMVPLPIALYSAIASPLQLLVSRMGARLLNLSGIPVLCQGNMMTLPGDVQMFVAEACSGMRQLTGFLALTTAVAYLSARPGWYRAAAGRLVDPDRHDGQRAPGDVTGLIMYHLNPELAMGRSTRSRAADDGRRPGLARRGVRRAEPVRRRPGSDGGGLSLGRGTEADDRARRGGPWSAWRS